MPIVDKIKGTLQGRYNYDARSISIRDTDSQHIINKYNPMLFCLNDDERASEEDRLRARAFLERMFPEKSEFEI